MAEVLVEYSDPIAAEDGRSYFARACGAEADNGKWHGWLEFTAAETGEVIRSGRETSQPNRTDTLYWATGLSSVYLEGALDRARHPLARPPARTAPQPRFDEPAPDFVPDAAPGESILNPFTAYRKGEQLLRRQLAALSAWHLANIVRDHGLSDLSPRVLDAMPASDLIEVIVEAVRSRDERAGAPTRDPAPAGRGGRTPR